MKTKLLFFSLSFLLTISLYNIKAQSLTGYWSSSTGNVFYIEDRGNGFLYRNVNFPDVFQAGFAWYNNFGRPVYKADFYQNYVYVFSNLFVVNDINHIYVYDSRNPTVVAAIWTRTSGNNNGNYVPITPSNNSKGKSQYNQTSKGKRQF